MFIESVNKLLDLTAPSADVEEKLSILTSNLETTGEQEDDIVTAMELIEIAESGLTEEAKKTIGLEEVVQILNLC